MRFLLLIVWFLGASVFSGTDGAVKPGQSPAGIRCGRRGTLSAWASATPFCHLELRSIL